MTAALGFEETKDTVLKPMPVGLATVTGAIRKKLGETAD